MKIIQLKLYGTIALMAFACCVITAFVQPKKKEVNNPPKVTISSPLNDNEFLWNSTIRYRITIADVEDGLSEYGEINTHEVVLEVCYLPDASKAKQYLAGKAKMVKENNGLTMLKKSDCFSCHASKNKLIGPSFELIAKRYPFNKNTIERLSKKIINGSAGTWGKTPMTPHKMLKAAEARQMVRWILANNVNPNLSFYLGTEGAFRVKEKPTYKNSTEVIVLTAAYTDHGEKGSMQNKKYGQHSILLKPVN